MFIDASAICAIILPEPDGDTLLIRISASDRKLSSPTAVWEAVVAITRVKRMAPGEAHALVTDLLHSAGIDIVAILPDAAALAVDAYARFGKGRHPAALNVGDCFAYACAGHYRMPLLYKGGDFALTDIEAA